MTPQNVCRFIVHISNDVCYSTINNYVSALNSLWRLRHDFSDLCEDYGPSLVLKGLKRLKGDSSEPMDPLLPSDLLNIKHHVSFSKQEEVVIWLIILYCANHIL